MINNPNIMDELAAYRAARDVAKEEADRTDQDGTPVFGFVERSEVYEISTGKPFDLAEYNVDFNIYAPDSEGFNLVVRKSDPEALHKLPKDKVRAILSKILDSV